jgi:hypothetical protein
LTQLTPADLLRILGVVTLIVAVPMVGGAIGGLVADRLAGTTPLLTLTGFGLGNVVAASLLWLYIRTQTRRLAGGRRRDDGADRP